MIPVVKDEIKNVCGVWLIAIASLCYCHSISAKLPKGKWRLISLVPILYIFTILPLYTTSTFFTFITASFITWISSFKLLLFAFGRGPIPPDPSLLIFIATAALPFKIKPTNTPKKPKKKLPLCLANEIPIGVALASIVHDNKQSIHPHIVLISYCCLVFVLIEIMFELSNLVIGASLRGPDLEDPSDEPYLSTSLREFWGRRWNLTVNALLRQAVYEPVRSATAAVVDGEMATATGVMAAFLVSGLMHELLFWYMIRTPPSWEVTMFFVVNGVCVVAEFRMAARKKWRMLPWFVAWPLTIGFVAWTSSWLFFPPLMRSGVDMKLTGEISYAAEVVKGVWRFAKKSRKV